MPDEKYPNNSFTKSSLDQRKEPPKPEKIISGKVRTHKKSLGQKFLDVILVEDLHKAAEHVFYDVLVPKAKDILADSVDTMLFGNPRNRGGGTQRNSTQGQYVPYSTLSQPRRSAPMPTQRTVTDNIIFESASDAHEVLSSLRSYIEEYDHVTVGYLYGLMGYQSDMTKENYGWYSLDGAAVVQTKEGYFLQLPKPVLLSR